MANKLRFGPKKAQGEQPKKVVGKLRKTQLITTFGNGAIVDMPDYSVILGGANYWKAGSHVLHEPNLERMLHVSRFKEPFVSESNGILAQPDIPAFRFPYMHFCPRCGRLMEFRSFGDEENRSCSQGHAKREDLVPSRFIAACINGHLEDFPYGWWVHRGDYSKCSPERHRNALRISFSDQTGGLEGIMIRCQECGARRTMAGSMGREALRGYRCHGKRPWLGMRKEYHDPTACDCQMRALQRGASNVYFSVTASALTIPPWSSRIQQEISEKWEKIESILASRPRDDILREHLQTVFSSLLAQGLYSLEKLVEEVRRRFDGSAEEEEYSGKNLREDEYQVFCVGDYEVETDRQFKIARTEVPSFLQDFIEDIVLAKCLREVLALRGFRRISPEVPGGDDEQFIGYHQEGDCIPLGDATLNWLPAIELLGEGIFIRLREEKLAAWEAQHGDRYHAMASRLERSNMGCENFSPRYVLLHTLSHLLIRQLSLECGYSGASVKERIYSTYPDSDTAMAGILLYTSSSDSDGSLGGLVRKGLPDSFEMIFRNMLQEASWCSSDPICIESKAQGYDSLNYAACHACALLPETSCEMRNCLLDRGAVAGTLANRDLGYFGSLL